MRLRSLLVPGLATLALLTPSVAAIAQGSKGVSFFNAFGPGLANADTVKLPEEHGFQHSLSPEAALKADLEQYKQFAKPEGKSKQRTAHAAQNIHARNVQIINKKGEKVTLDGSGTAVAVLDDGLVDNHPALQKPPAHPKIKINGKSQKIIWGANWADGEDQSDFTREPDQEPYHGLHVTGIIAGNGPSSNDQDAPYFKGIAPETQIIFHKVQKRSDASIVKDHVMMAAMHMALTQGADAINLSLGSDSATTQSAAGIRDGIAEANSKGAVVVATSGNQGYVGQGDALPLATNPDYGTVARPALAPMTISTNAMENGYKKGHAFKLGGTTGEDFEFRQPGDQYYNGIYASRYRWANDWWGYDSDYYDYAKLNEQDIQVVKVDLPTVQNLQAADVRGKFVLVPRKIPGLSTEDNNPGNLRPDFILAVKNAKSAGAAGVIIDSNLDGNFGFDIFEPTIYKTDPNNPKEYIWDDWDELIDYPIMAVSKQTALALEADTSKTVHFNAFIHDFSNPTGLQMADYSSRGVSSDFVFKGDLSTPSSSNVISLGQRVYYDDDHNRKSSLGLVRNQGTSMGAPQISGAVALIRQRLNEQYPELSKADGRSADLVKNLLMSAAKPQAEKFGPAKGIFYSPRAQGNGLLDVNAAAHSDVVAVSPADSNDNETGYAKTNLREISDHKIKFQVELQNYSHESRSFTPYLYVMSDQVADGRFTMHSKNLTDPIKLSPVTIPARQAESRTPGTVKVPVEYTLSEQQAKELKQLAPNGYFVEGYVQFEPTGASSNEKQETVTHSFVGFDGDWFAAPMHDPFIYDLKDGQKPFYYNVKATKSRPRTGDLKSTHLESFLDGNKQTILGALPDHRESNISVSDQHLAISPNDDGNMDAVNPVYTILRNYNDINIKVTDEDHNKVFDGHYGLGITDRKKNFGYESGYVFENVKTLSWNGKDVEGRPLPEGLYTLVSSVQPDIVNKSNRVLEKKMQKAYPKDFAEKREFKIRIDMTAPVLRTTKVVSEDGDNKVVKFNIEDPTLGKNKVPGSGVYKAELITPSGTKVIQFDPLKPETLTEQEFAIPADQFEQVKLRLTDWAYNTATYRPAYTQEGLDTGYLKVNSIDSETDEALQVGYNLVDVKNAHVYPADANIPVGTYRIEPNNPPEGYTLSTETKPEDLIVQIVKDKTAKRTLKFDRNYNLTQYSVFNTKSETIKKSLASLMVLKLTNLDTGVTYTSSLTSGGEFGGKILEGVYKVEFLNAPKGTTPTLWDRHNKPIKVLRVSTSEALVSREFTLDNKAPGQVTNVDPEVAEYLKDQTYLMVRGLPGAIPTVKVFNDHTLSEQALVISKDNKEVVRSVKELPSKYGENESLYYFDLTDQAIEKLQPGMVLQPTQVKGDVNATNKKVAVVGYNGNLTNQMFVYLKHKAEGTQHEATVKKISDDYLYRWANPADSYRYNVRHPGNLVNRDSEHPETGNEESNASLKDVVELQKAAAADAQTEMQKIQDLLGAEGKVPILRAHHGQFPNMITALYPRDHDGYKFTNTPTTSIVNDLRAVCEGQKYFFGDFTTDIDGNPTVPKADCSNTDALKAEGYNQAALLSPLSGYVKPSSWKRIDGGSSADDILGDAKSGYRLEPKNGTASYSFDNVTVRDLKIHSMEEVTNNNLAKKQLTLRGNNRNEAITTDVSGHYLVQALTPGEYTLSRGAARSAETAKNTWKIKVTEDGVLNVDGKVLEPASELAVLYPREIVRQVKVHAVEEGTKRNLAGMALSLSGNGRQESLTTDTNGVCTLENLIPGEYTLSRTAPSGADNQKKQWTIEISDDGVVTVDGKALGLTGELVITYPKVDPNPNLDPGTSDTDGQGGQGEQGDHGKPPHILKPNTGKMVLANTGANSLIPLSLFASAIGLYLVFKRRRESE